METKQNAIIDKIEGLKEKLLALSHQIHQKPELGFEEFHAVELMEDLIVKEGFSFERNYCDLPTAFKVTCKGKSDGPKISFLAEYDALRGIGHGCGHNVIATCATGAFLGLASVIKELGGEVSLIGTPAEEGGAGKVILLERGGFQDTEYALMMHPACANYNLVNRGGRASTSVTVSFEGRATHSSAPQSGINALTAAIHVFNQIDMLRTIFDPQDNINGVILEGGTASNIIPQRAVCEFCIRAETMKRVKELAQMVEQCAKRAQEITGAQATVEAEHVYAERYPNLPMCDTFKKHMENLGVAMDYADPAMPCGSSDIGNVSIEIPAIHDYLSITQDPLVTSHSEEFARESISLMADQVCILGAEGLALTALDILTDQSLREQIKAYHKKQIPEFYKKDEV